VRAQVKISFRSTIGESYVMTRNVQLTVNNQKKRSQKALDASLLLRNNGERTVISTRVGDLDKLVPEKLGTITPILDYVVFCHQDESLWPMSEPAALKKRFDEIFEASKYTKVLDNIKLLRKKQGEQLRLLVLQETQDKANKERADKVDRLLTQLTREIQDSRDKCNEILQQMDEETLRIKDKYEQANTFLKVVNDLQTKTEKLEYKKEAIEELQSRIEEMPDSDQALRNILDEYERTAARTIADRDAKLKDFQDLQVELKQSRQQHTAKAAERGKHQSDKDKYERQLSSRSRMIKEAAERHEIRGYGGDLDENQIRAFYDRIQKVLNEKKRDLERLQQENATEFDQKAGLIAERESKKTSLQRDRASASQRMGSISRDVATLQSELGGLDIDEGAEAVLRTDMRELEARIETAKADEQAVDLDSQIRATNDEIWKLEAQAAKLSRELVDCTRLASERAQLDLRKKQLTERRRELDILRNTWNDQLSTIVAEDWKSETIETEYQGALKRQGNAVAERRKQKDVTQQELKQLEYKLSATRDRQGKINAERERCKAIVVKTLKAAEADSISFDSYVDEVDKIGNELKEAETELKLFGALKDYYQGAKEQAMKHNKCKLCSRSFGTDETAKSKLLDRVTKAVNEATRKELTDFIETEKPRLSSVQSARPQYDTYLRLEGELPPLLKDINAMTTQKEELIRKLEDHDVAYREAEEKWQEVDALGKNVLKIAQTYKDILDSERQIERSQQSSSIAMRSPEEINDEQTICADQTRLAQTKLSKLTVDRQRMKDLVSQLEVEKIELRHKITNAAQQLERKKALQESIRRHKEEQNQLREAVLTANREIEGIEPEILSAKTALEESRRQCRAKEQRVTEERDAVATTVSELKMINSEIQEYLDRGGPSNLASNQRAIAALEASIANLETDMKNLTVQINKLNKDIDNSDAKKRNISDNLTYRKNLRERDALEREIDELESRNAQEDYDRLTQEARYLESRRAKLSADRERLMGSMSSKDEQFARLNEEYEIELKDAKAKYKESHIKVETTRASIDDLGRGQMVVDQAIIGFHTLKMEEINRTIGELWQSTYQGTDIDTIQIRSDMEVSANVDSTKQRNYNYRVSMVKGDTEMDMRGRCSAGQKVLASIIIRLALAESFGINCGLIALDEPTTNLDSDNIRSLAESLHAIIKARQSQNNLQLIVITHDEEFLKHMQCSEFCDDFYRVRRDERQNSVIVRESITRITE